MTDGWIKRALGNGGRQLKALHEQKRWLMAYGHLEAAEMVSTRAQVLTVRMESVRRRLRARAVTRGA